MTNSETIESSSSDKLIYDTNQNRFYETSTASTENDAVENEFTLLDPTSGEAIFLTRVIILTFIC
jgi:hypothetical protein